MIILKKILSKIYFIFYKTNYLLFKYKIKRQFSFRPYIISIGNITAGGTGKTPMIITISELLSEANFNHAIISRGYKRKNKKTIIQSSQHVNNKIEDLGDEPFFLSQKLPRIPIVVGNKKNAINACLKAFKYKIILIDDGFQSLSIKRDCDIVLIDLSRKISEYELLPLGLLREPLKNISRANVIIFTKSNHDQGDGEKIQTLVKSFIDYNKTALFKSKFLSDLKKYSFKKNKFIIHKTLFDKKVIAFCGVAKPLIFNQLTKSYCKKTTPVLNFPDHCCYERDEVSKIKEELRRIEGSAILTTMKDFYKVYKSFQGYDIYIIEIYHAIENPELFKALLLNKISTN